MQIGYYINNIVRVWISYVVHIFIVRPENDVSTQLESNGIYST